MLKRARYYKDIELDPPIDVYVVAVRIKNVTYMTTYYDKEFLNKFPNENYIIKNWSNNIRPPDNPLWSDIEWLRIREQDGFKSFDDLKEVKKTRKRRIKRLGIKEIRRILAQSKFNKSLVHRNSEQYKKNKDKK